MSADRPTTLDIADATVVPLDRLGVEGRFERSVLSATPHLLPLSELVRVGPLHELVEANHQRTLAPPPLQLYAVGDAEISPIGTAHIDGRFLHAPDLYCGYVRSLFDVDPGLFAAGGTITRTLPGVAAIFSVQSRYYGHFLLEMLPKVYLLAQLAERIGNPPIALPDSVPSYMIEMIRALHPSARFVDLKDGPIRAQTVYLPSMCNIEYRYNSMFVAALRAYAGTCELSEGRGAEKIYVTRAGWSGSTFVRHITNEQEMLEKLAARGFSIVAPHELTWRQKAAAFSSAHTIIGEVGSGLHNSILSGAGTRIISLNWCNEVQQQLAHSCGHVVAVLLPSDGRPRRPSDHDAADTTYAIDLVELDKVLDTLGL